MAAKANAENPPEVQHCNHVGMHLREEELLKRMSSYMASRDMLACSKQG